MEKIALRGFTDPVKIEAEAKSIELATQHTEKVLSDYAARPDTYGGRYVCADSFKEQMPGFSQSRESRSALNGAVHNAAAVLSSEQYRRMVDKGPEPGQDTVYFVTGIPGAGKSSTVAGAVVEGSAAVVFEGQMSRPEPTMKKIEQALEKGFKVEIVAVHVAPEVALARTNSRYLDPGNGRGASLSVMADIQGNLPAGLRQIREQFGDQVGLSVLDNNPGRQKLHTGWQSIRELEKEGTRDDIHSRLAAALDAGHQAGRYSSGFYLQAAGREPRSHAAGPGPQDGRSIEAHGDRSRLPQTDPEHDALNKERARVFREDQPEKALQQHPELAPAYGYLQAREARAQADGLTEKQRETVMARVRETVAERIERGDVPSVEIREQQQAAPRGPER